MTNFLLKLLLWKDTTAGGHVEGLRLPRCDTPAGAVLFIGLLVAGFLLIRYAYRRDVNWVTPPQKRLLAGLRAGTLIVVLFIASGAFLEVASRFEGTGTVMVLVDRSQSMALVDKRDGADLQVAGELMGDASRAATATRQDLLVADFRDPKRDPVRLLEGRFKVEAFAFGESPALSPLALAADPGKGPLGGLAAPADRATQLGAAISDAQRRARGRRLDAVIVASDGGWNRGEDPVEAAKALGAPVIALGVGSPQSKDIEIPFLFCEDTVFKNDRFTLDVRIRQRGFAGRTVKLEVRRLDADGREEVVKEDSLPLGEDREFVHPVELVPDREGVFTYIAEVIPQPEEANTVNNKKARANVQVVDRKLRVLVVDDTPRWEFRFIRGVLEADRSRVQPTFILRQGDRNLDSHGVKFLRQFPADAKALRDYDCVILGDIGPDFFTSDELKGLETWLRTDGGGLVVVAGRRAMPLAWAGSTLEQLLPVEPDAQAAPTVADEMARTIKDGVRPQVTPEGQRWAALRFSADPAENEALWRDVTPMQWYAPVKRLKSGAAALLVHPTRQAGDGNLPLLAVHRYGRGQVAWLGSDETWRWRFKPGVAQHRRLWGQMVSTLGMAHLLGNTSRVQVDTDRTEYAVGDHAQIIARVLDADYNPLRADAVTAVIERDLASEKVVLAAKREQPGVFTGEWVPGTPGRVRVVVSAGGAGAEASEERLLTVVEPHLEQDDGGMREDLLRAVAQASGGMFLPLADSGKVADILASREREGDLKHAEVTLWNAPGVIVLLVLLLGLEWWYRKRWDMM